MPETDESKPHGTDVDENHAFLLRQKRVLKTRLTKARLQLTAALCSGRHDSNGNDVQQAVDQILNSQLEVIDVLVALCDIDEEKYGPELDIVQHDPVIVDILAKATEFLCTIKATGQRETTTDNPTKAHTETGANSNTLFQIDKDLHGQLKRVSIPTFNGNKKDYQIFKDAFTECIDKANCSDGYKMLQLRQYLKSRALDAIEGFPASTVGYEAAKKRLDEKYGGSRRKILILLDSIRFTKMVNFQDIQSLESFSDKLELSIITLKDMGRSEEFDENSMFYCVAKSKLSPVNIAHYKRWAATIGNIENLISLHKWLSTELRYRVEAFEEVEGFEKDKYPNYPKSKSNFGSSSNSRTYTTYESSKNANSSCLKCGSTHEIQNCSLFRALSLEARWDFAKSKQLCYRCLSSLHFGSKCSNAQRCGIDGCPRTHHSLLHGEGYSLAQNYSTPPSQSTDENSIRTYTRPANHSQNTDRFTRTRSHATSTLNGDFVAMRCVPVILVNGDKIIEANVLLDECSTDSYFEENSAAELGVSGPLSSLSVGVLGGTTTPLNTTQVNLVMKILDGKYVFQFNAYTVKNVTGDMHVVDWNTQAQKWPHLAGIDFPRVSRNNRVNLLIGLNVPGVHRCLTEIAGRPGEPVARLTPLGWTCIGPCDPLISNSQNHFARAYFTQNNDTNSLIRRMWELESMGVTSSRKQDAPTCKNIELDDKVRSSLSFDNNHYRIKIPWKDNEPSLHNNYELARSRLLNLEKSLTKRPLVASSYCNIIQDHIGKSYVKEIMPPEKYSENIWYLPHFPVVRPDKHTTKVRLVMDAAAQFQNKSLNDCIFQGPKLQRELIDILIRFRSSPVAVVADITEMFLQVEMTPQDRRFHRFLWRDMNINLPIREYEYQRLVFGNTASPYLSQTVIREHAKNNCKQFPIGSDSVLNSMYVDDLLDSVDTIAAGKKLRHEISDLLLSGGFEIRKWLSNEPRVLEDVPEKDRLSSLTFEDENLTSTKTLGILWNANKDIFAFNVEPPFKHIVLTKRFVVSKTATLFDPLNLLAPFTIRAKIGIQSSWIYGIDWDDELPIDLAKHWTNWFMELEQLCLINVRRCLVSNESTIKSKTVHTFVDSSEKAYAACCYLRCYYEDGTVSVNLIAAKTRVTPLKAVSIPKLELCGAVLGLRLTQTVCGVLNISTSEITYWSDSQNVLFWIRGESRTYKPFVSHRVGEIHELSDPETWRYVPSKLNSSDCATRGLSVVELRDCNLWWYGPEFLYGDAVNWPVDPRFEPLEAREEIRQTIKADTFVVVQHVDFGRLQPERFSKWLSLVRVVAWIYRFTWNCQNKDKHRDKFLTSEELSRSENVLYRLIQGEVFRDEICDLRKNRPISSNSASYRVLIHFWTTMVCYAFKEDWKKLTI